jgi:DNA polymerase III delta prime subunit
MKFYETHFEEYITENQRDNLHPKLNKLYEKFPKQFNDLKNLIFYGPNGVGKYTQMLKAIKRYSPTELKYEKKLSVVYNRQQFFFKISDIHYEIDMSLLGCNSKLLWHEIYLQIIDIVSAKNDKVGIIVCKNFHEIHSELLDNFYSYMQKNNAISIDLKFILVTKELSFIPDNIVNCCEIIHVSRPTATSYVKCLKKKLPSNLKLENITNIKNIHLYKENLMQSFKIISNKVIDNIINFNNIQFMKFRDIIYDLLIYNLDI